MAFNRAVLLAYMCNEIDASWYSTKYNDAGLKKKHRTEKTILSPLRIKIWRDCPPRVSWPPPNQTQSWQPFFPVLPRALDWRLAHLPVPRPRSEMIGSSAWAVARNHALPWFHFFPEVHKELIKLWIVPFLWPEASRLPPPSSLPLMAGRLWVTLTFPRQRVRLRCTCALKTLPLGWIVLTPVQSL